MPFVGTKRSKQLVKGEIDPKQVGDLCAIAYSPIIKAWRKNPRWTTVHRIIKPMLPQLKKQMRKTWAYFELSKKNYFTDNDCDYAVDLAYEVFFGLYVLNYERKKLKENGDVY